MLDLSPDDRRLAVHVADVNDYILVYDIERREERRLPGVGIDGWPRWSGNGDSIVFASRQPGSDQELFIQPVTAAEKPRRISVPGVATRADSWSADGKLLAFGDSIATRIGLLSTSSGSVEWIDAGKSSQWGGAFSPDSQWLAYSSNETGVYEVWVRSLADSAIVRQLSVFGGVEPV